MTTQPEQQTTAPEVVAWQVLDGDGDVYHLAWGASAEAEARKYEGRGRAVVPLVTLAYADAQVREAEARIVAWLRANTWEKQAADRIERGEHRA